MKRTILFHLFMIFLLGGCAPWVTVGGKYTMSSQNYEVELPNGWRRHSPTSDALLITKDGLLLQHISIARIAFDKELPYTKKKFSKGMLPQEVAEVVIDNMRTNPSIINLRIAENIPAKIGGHSGFKMIYLYQTEGGLKKKGVYYGFLLDDWHYKIIYEAPARYYFEEDLPAFEKVKKTFRIL